MTEGGYYLNTRHRLETSNPDLQADLQGECKTIYGTLARILEKRMADNAGPLTLLNCDNVRHNGERFHDGMVEFLQLTGKQAVIDWMAANTTCPNTMVDRITPRPAADLPARIKAQTGIDDKAPVMGETFIQWVVENNFRDVRPNLEAVGVEMVESVIPYEEAKIRILNASHSCIAWAGTLIGQQYIHESTLTDVIYAIADRYVTEDVIPCLGDNGIDLPTYRDVVLKRFTNPLYPGHQPARRRRRLLENSGDDRANLAGVLPARRPPGSDRHAAGAVLRLYGAVAQGNSAVSVPGRHPGCAGGA